MVEEEINYVKEILKSEVNLAFIGIMAFFMLVFNFWGFLPFLVAGEIGAIFIAQNPRVQRLIRARKNKDQKLESEDTEKNIVMSLPANYQQDFHSVRTLCEEIEKRSNELGDVGNKVMISGVIERLFAFRIEYAKMLRAHHLLSTRNYRNLQTMLTNEIGKAEKAVEREQSPAVRQALSQNLSILKKRLGRIQKLDELVRLLEARIHVVKNSLSLIQDEVYSFTDVAGISDLVGSLLDNLSISDEFRSAYEDVLVTEGDNLVTLEAAPEESGMSDWNTPPAEEQPRRPQHEHLRRVK